MKNIVNLFVSIAVLMAIAGVACCESLSDETAEYIYNIGYDDGYEDGLNGDPTDYDCPDLKDHDHLFENGWFDKYYK